MFFPEISLKVFLIGTLLFLVGDHNTPVTSRGVESRSGSQKSQVCPLLNQSQSPSGTSFQDLKTPSVALYNLTGDPKMAEQSQPAEVLNDGKPNGNFNVFAMVRLKVT